MHSETSPLALLLDTFKAVIILNVLLGGEEGGSRLGRIRWPGRCWYSSPLPDPQVTFVGSLRLMPVKLLVQVDLVGQWGLIPGRKLWQCSPNQACSVCLGGGWSLSSERVHLCPCTRGSCFRGPSPQMTLCPDFCMEAAACHELMQISATKKGKLC